MAAGLTRAGAGHSQELCCAAGKVSACGVCLEKVPARVLSAPKGTPGVVQAEDGLGRAQGSWPLWEGSRVRLGRRGERFSCSKPYLLP